MSFEQLWAGWRSEYVSGVGDPAPTDTDACVFCRILSSGEGDEDTGIVWRGGRVVAILNAFPYTSGHLMVLSERHVGEIEDLATEEAAELWQAVTAAVRALKQAYAPDGVNVGANLGRAAGAGVPGHFHLHVLPRWQGDTNFMTAVAGVRVMPESLDVTWQRIHSAWQV